MAANAVFNTYELVLLIAPHLDELSLVRMQGVNQTSRNVINESSTLRRKIGLKHNDKPALHHSQVGTKDCERMAWSPFLDWFSMRTLPNLLPRYGPLNDYNPANNQLFSNPSATLILLPHAYRAALNPESKIHNISITDPPVSSIMLVTAYRRPTKSEHRIFFETNEKHLYRKDGITIGYIFKAWAQLVAETDRGVPICLGFSTSALTIHYFSHVLDKTSQYLHSFRPRATCDGSRKRGQIVQEWYKRTVGDYESWNEADMEEQSVYVHQVLKRWKLAIPRTAKRWTDSAAWPALALKGTEDKGKKIHCPYTVDFACGIVFNNADESTSEDD